VEDDAVAVLSYAARPPRHRRPWWQRHFHVWLLPLVWLPGAWGARVHHGDEFIGFAMAHFPCLVILWPLQKVVGPVDQLGLEIGQIFLIVIAAGFVLWTLVGWLLDRLRAWKSVYVIMPLVLLLFVARHWSIPGHVPPMDYYAGQEWEWDSVYVAYCWAVYAVAVVTLVGAAVTVTVSACIRYVHGRMKPAQ